MAAVLAAKPDDKKGKAAARGHAPANHMQLDEVRAAAARGSPAAVGAKGAGARDERRGAPAGMPLFARAARPPTAGQANRPRPGLRDALSNRGMKCLRETVVPRVPISTQMPFGTIQRACACGGKGSCECDEPRTALPLIQRKAGESGAVMPSPSLASAALSGHGPGRPLDASSRALMEPRFGRDFGSVRIHTDAAASRAARMLQAEAFTAGGDVYFAEGRYRPETAPGRRLLAHELTHTVQQGGGGTGAIARSSAAISEPHDASEREADSIADRVVAGLQVSTPITASAGTIQRQEDGGSSIWDTVTSAVSSAVTSVEETVASGVQTVEQAASEAVSWIETEAGQLALAAANELAARFGGTVSVVGTAIIITIPDIEICTPTSIPVLTLPMENILIPFWGWAGVFGPVGIGAAAGIRIGGQPSIAVSYGPCRLRGLSLLVDPLAATYVGTGQLYIAGAVTETAVIEGALKAIGVVGLFDPPIALMAGVEGGLRATVRGIGAGALQETVRVAYIGGSFSFDLLNTLKLGASIEADLDFFANASLYDFVICEYVLPIGSWTLASDADRYDLPVSVAGGSVTVGPVTSKPIPFSDIEVFINRTRPQTRCLSLSEIREELCRRGYLPPSLCPTTPGPPSVTPPTPVGPLGPVVGISCGSVQATPSGSYTQAGGPYDGRTIEYGQTSNKHTKVADCTVKNLEDVMKDPTKATTPGLKDFVKAVAAKDSAYGSQLASESMGSKYRDLLQDGLKDGSSNTDKSAFHHVASKRVGVDVVAQKSTPGYGMRLKPPKGASDPARDAHLFPDD
jgi:hypothetical protein